MKRTLLFLASWTLCAHAMDNGIIADGIPQPFCIDIPDTPANRDTESTDLIKTQKSEKPAQPKKWRSYVKKAAICTSMLGCLVASTIGVSYAYNSISGEASTLEGECTECETKLKNAEALLNQAPVIADFFAQAGPALSEFKEMMPTVRWLITLVQTCPADMAHTLAAVNALCSGS